MLDAFYPSDEYETAGDQAFGPNRWLPDDIVADPSLRTEQKRAILASWASDAHAVADAPALRQLDDGTLLDIDTILDALKRLDGIPSAAPPAPRRWRDRLRHGNGFAKATRRPGTSRRSDDDDDDPPPCPAAARVPRLPPGPCGGAIASAA